MGYGINNAPVYRRARGEGALPVALLREALQVFAARNVSSLASSLTGAGLGRRVDIATDGCCQGARTAALRSQS